MTKLGVLKPTWSEAAKARGPEESVQYIMRRAALTERAVRGDADVVRFSHDRNLLRLGDATGVSDVGLDDVDAPGLKVGPNVLAREEALAKLPSALFSLSLAVNS